ncbi:MAG: SMC-Scp complex subunit ScpB [Caldisericaceae bacterium]
MDKEKYIYAIESILFISAKPVKIEKISLTLSLDKMSVRSLLLELENILKETGINLKYEKDRVSLVPNESYKTFFEKFIKKKKTMLSRNLLEVVGLLLKKKRTKEEIDKIRGVNSARVINELIKLGYVEKEFYDKQIFYKVSQKFYEKLPKEIKEKLEKKIF